MKMQFINDVNGNPEYVVLAIADFNKIANVASVAPVFEIDSDSEEWLDVEYQVASDDDVTIPHEVVNIMLNKGVSLLAAWRLYRGFTQNQVAEKLDISQANLSQIEKKNKKPHQSTLLSLAEIYDCCSEQLTGI